LYFFRIRVAFLDDLLRILNGWEEEHLILLMSFAGTFSTLWCVMRAYSTIWSDS
jgi:hypothetical protein